MIVSRFRYICICCFIGVVIGVLMLIGIPLANTHLFHKSIIDTVCKYLTIIFLALFLLFVSVVLITNRGPVNLIRNIYLRNCVERNLISIGAYTDNEDKPYVVLPRIKIKESSIQIKLTNVYLRSIIEEYLDIFSTALPEHMVVEDYYFSRSNTELIIEYSDLRSNKEKYSLSEYIDRILAIDRMQFYISKKHIIDVNDHPHLCISGSSGSGKSYLANQIVIQAIKKEWDVVILDMKRSYGLYQSKSDYYYEPNEILDKLLALEVEMYHRMEWLQPHLDKNPKTLAIDIGFSPILVVLEEYISLQSAFEKKQKEELERVVKNLSVLARQANIHLMIVMQSAGTENINSTTRSNLTKILLGNAQSNILTATFGSGVKIPSVNTKLDKGEGLLQLNSISLIRVPEITDIENFNITIGE